MTPAETVTTYIAALGSAIAIILSVLGYYNQLNQRKAEERKTDSEMQRIQSEIATKVWNMAQAQILSLEEDLAKTKATLDELVLELEVERKKRRTVETDLRRTTAILIAVLAQMAALNIQPNIPDEDQTWLNRLFAD